MPTPAESRVPSSGNPPSHEPRNPRRVLLRIALFGLPFVLLYGLNARTVLIGDSQAHLYLAASMAWSGDADLGEFRTQLVEAGGGQLPYFAIEERGPVRSIFNFFPAVLLAPFFWLFGIVGGEAFRGSLDAWGLTGKFVATLFVFAAGVPLWGLLRHRVRPSVAVLALAGFWIGTPLWPASVDYLQHNPMVFFKLGALWALFGGSSGEARRPRFFLGGLALALSVLCRYQTLPSAAVLALLVFVRHLRTPGLWRFLLGGMLPAPFAFAYHFLVFGAPLALGPNPWLRFDQPLLGTSFALLFNPSKGLAVHSPWIALGIGMLAWRTLRGLRWTHALRLPGVAFFSSVPTFLLYAKLNGWFGGWCWGYRYLLDLLPEAVLLAAFGLQLLWWRGVVARGVIAAALACSIMVQTIGALCYDTEWHKRHDLGVGPSQAWVWQLRHSQIAYYARRGTIYLGGMRAELRPSPFEDRGLYEQEFWGEIPVRWTERRASFLYVARRFPAGLVMFPHPETGDSDVLRVMVRLNDRPPYEVHLVSGQWTFIPLEPLPYQHSAVVTIEAPSVFTEPGGLRRDLGVALDMRAFAKDQ